jgi:hypothetical protein
LRTPATPHPVPECWTAGQGWRRAAWQAMTQHLPMNQGQCCYYAVKCVQHSHSQLYAAAARGPSAMLQSQCHSQSRPSCTAPRAAAAPPAVHLCRLPQQPEVVPEAGGVLMSGVSARTTAPTGQPRREGPGSSPHQAAVGEHQLNQTGVRHPAETDVRYLW